MPSEGDIVWLCTGDEYGMPVTLFVHPPWAGASLAPGQDFYAGTIIDVPTLALVLKVEDYKGSHAPGAHMRSACFILASGGVAGWTASNRLAPFDSRG